MPSPRATSSVLVDFTWFEDKQLGPLLVMIYLKSSGNRKLLICSSTSTRITARDDLAPVELQTLNHHLLTSSSRDPVRLLIWTPDGLLQGLFQGVHLPIGRIGNR